MARDIRRRWSAAAWFSGQSFHASAAPTTLSIVRTPAPAKLTLSAPEWTACAQLLARGKTLPQALDAIRAQRAFLATFPLAPRS